MDSGGRGGSTDETRQKEESTQPIALPAGITALLRSSGGKQDAHVIQYTQSGFVFPPDISTFFPPWWLKIWFL